MRDDFSRGVHDAAKKKAVREIAAALRKQFTPSSVADSPTTLKFAFEISPEGPKATAGMDKEVSFASMFGWMLDSLPGRRYRKLLTQVTHAQSERARLEDQLRTLWLSS
jgi:hypothetical protein